MCYLKLILNTLDMFTTHWRIISQCLKLVTVHNTPALLHLAAGVGSQHKWWTHGLAPLAVGAGLKTDRWHHSDSSHSPPTHSYFQVQDLRRKMFIRHTHTCRMCSEMKEWRCPTEWAKEQYNTNIRNWRDQNFHNINGINSKNSSKCMNFCICAVFLGETTAVCQSSLTQMLQMWWKVRSGNHKREIYFEWPSTAFVVPVQEGGLVCLGIFLSHQQIHELHNRGHENAPQSPPHTIQHQTPKNSNSRTKKNTKTLQHQWHIFNLERVNPSSRLPHLGCNEAAMH